MWALTTPAERRIRMPYTQRPISRGTRVLSGRRINPLVGAAGISAFPMAARVVNRVGLEEDFGNFLLMHAMGANVAGQVASVVAGGVLLALLGAR